MNALTRWWYRRRMGPELASGLEFMENALALIRSVDPVAAARLAANLRDRMALPRREANPYDHVLDVTTMTMQALDDVGIRQGWLTEEQRWRPEPDR